MTSSIRDNQKSKRGRPATGGRGQMIGVRLTSDQLSTLDSWIEVQPDPITRPEAIRRLMLQSIEGDEFSKWAAADKARSKAE